jgi:hypothetical protein
VTEPPTPIRHSSRREHALCVLGRLMIVSSPGRRFDDAEWAEHCRHCREALRDRCVEAILVFSPRTGPTAAQREELRRAFSSFDLHDLPRTAMVSASAITRASIAAVSPLMKLTCRAELRAFRPNALNDAFVWLAEATPIDPEQGLALLNEMRRAQSADCA